jgi:hypothetical protein
MARNVCHDIGFAVLTAVVTKSSVFWNITGLSLLPASCWRLAWLIFQPERWRRQVTRKRRLAFNGIHDVIPQKKELFLCHDVQLLLRNVDLTFCVKNARIQIRRIHAYTYTLWMKWGHECTRQMQEKRLRVETAPQWFSDIQLHVDHLKIEQASSCPQTLQLQLLDI